MRAEAEIERFDFTAKTLDGAGRDVPAFRAAVFPDTLGALGLWRAHGSLSGARRGWERAQVPLVRLGR